MLKFVIKPVWLLCLICFAGAITPGFSQRNRKNKIESIPPAARQMAAERYFTEGEKYYILEDFSKSLFYFEQANEYSPDNAAIHYKMAEIFLRGNKESDLMSAAHHAEEALRLEHKNKFYYQLASRIYINQQQYAKAAAVLETMLKEVNGAEEDLFELAGIYAQNNQLDEAFKTYDRAETVMGVNEISSFQKERILILKNKNEEARHEAEKLLSAYPDEERFFVRQAEILLGQRDFAHAIPLLEKFVESHAEAGHAKVMLANLYRESGDEAKSRKYVLQIIDDPNVETGNKVLMIATYNALLTQNKGNAELNAFAQDLFTRLKKSSPHDPEVCFVGGDLLFSLDKPQEAREQYAQGLRLEPNRLEAWQSLLFIEEQANQLDSVIAHAERALEFFPNQVILYYFNGLALLQKKQFRQAIQVMEQTRRFDSKNKTLQSEIFGMLGDAYNAVHDNDRSDKAFEDALVMNPNNDYVLNNYSYFLSLRNVNLEKAERMAAQACKSQPQNTAFLDTYAWVLYQMGRYKDARREMEKVFAIGAGSAVNYEHYGDILYRLGHVDDAVIQWQKAKALNGSSEALNQKIQNKKIF